MPCCPQKNIAPAQVVFSHFKFSAIFQVLLQTYIEHLRGKVEDLKEVTVNNHGKGRTYIVSTYMYILCTVYTVYIQYVCTYMCHMVSIICQGVHTQTEKNTHYIFIFEEEKNHKFLW